MELINYNSLHVPKCYKFSCYLQAKMKKNYHMMGKVLPYCSVAFKLTFLFNYRLSGFAGCSNAVIPLRMGNVVIVKLILKTGAQC